MLEGRTLKDGPSEDGPLEAGLLDAAVLERLCLATWTSFKVFRIRCFRSVIVVGECGFATS